LLFNSVARVPHLDLVAISTTLATNAIVEGHGSPVCLILIGQDSGVLDRFGLRQALGGDPAVMVDGGHTYSGVVKAPLDEEAIREAVRTHGGQVAGFAVVAHFGVLNPEHELRARDIIRESTNQPVTCSHELTARLNAPRRALTCVLNGRLIPMLDRLIGAVRSMLAARGITAPVMVVQGDGSLVAADVARHRPVETILSGPAASLIGAAFLARSNDAVISDMGGTTTDLGLLKDGRPVLSPDGATVGGWRTMVEAVDIATVGFGGDSEVGSTPQDGFTFGPQRAIPLSLLATRFPEVVGVLREQLEAKKLDECAGQFAIRQRDLGTDPARLSEFDRLAWSACSEKPIPLDVLFDDATRRLPFQALRRRGLASLAAFTPSDAAHVLGIHGHWNREAAELGARIWARRLGHRTEDQEQEALRFCRRLMEEMTLAGAEIVANFMLDHGEGSMRILPQSRDAQLIRMALTAGHKGALRLRLLLDLPIVAVGAPAQTYYPAIAERLSADVVIPEHAGVCNAIGAVVGGVVQRVEARITSPGRGAYRVHSPEGIDDFPDLETAVRHASETLEKLAREKVTLAGGKDIDVTTAREDRNGREPGGAPIFVETRLRVTAAGRPGFA
jgi:N-methylhydantoinase A/oxoprolinase/acetone carboxylase beta subunit